MCKIPRPKTKDLLLLSNEIEYMWNYKEGNRYPFQEFYKDNLVVVPLNRILEMIKEANPWFTFSYLEFKYRLMEIPEMRELFYKTLEHRVDFLEDQLSSGEIFNEVSKHTRVDSLGNVDIAPGYLNLAKAKAETIKFFLEKTRKQYKDSTIDNLPKLGVVIMPSKETNDEA